MKEPILNCCLSTHLDKLGLEHISSEVHKNIFRNSIGKYKAQDILCYDIESNIPIIIELKRNKSRRELNELEQLLQYIQLISEDYPDTFSQLYANRNRKIFDFQYHCGIVGIVLTESYDIPKLDKIYQDILDKNTVFWATYSLSNSLNFQIENIEVLSRGNYWSEKLEKLPSSQPVDPTELLGNDKDRYPNLSNLIRLLDEAYYSISDRIYAYYKFDNNYIAYRGTDTTKAILGIYRAAAGKIYANFHVNKNYHREFLSSNEIKKLESVGINYKIQDGKIINIILNNDFINTISPETICFLLTKLAISTYNLAKISEVENFIISDESNLKINAHISF
jgi:hypothetical protein